MEPILRTEHLTFTYPGEEHPSLGDLSLEIERGSFVAILGHNGSGKSTLAKLFNAILLPTGGKVYVDGMDTADENNLLSVRATVGMVFQKPNPFPMSVYDNIAYGPRTHGVKKKAELDEIVEKSLRDAAIWDELKDRLKKSALGLSGGQQQRLCIARALAVKPEVILMDEPTSALDPISTSKIEDLVMDIKKEYTIVMVTHNMHQALTLGNRTLMMNAGNIVLDVAGEERAAMSVDDLLEQFALRAGKALDNDRILFSKVETQE